MKILFTLSVAMLPLFAFGQWEGSGNVQYFLGDVGIGLTSPHGKLHVKGVGYFGNENETSSHRVAVGGSGNDYGSVGYGYLYTGVSQEYTYIGSTYASQLRFEGGGFSFRTAPPGPFGDLVPFKEAFRIYQDGTVSVGSWQPSVQGYGSRFEFLGASSNGDPLWLARYNNGDNASQLRLNIGDDYGQNGDMFVVGTVNWSDGNWYPHLAVQASGNIGIGTASPDYKLDVSGGLKAGNTVSSPSYNDHLVVQSDGNVAFEGGQIFTNKEGSGVHGIKFSSAYSGTSDPDFRIGVVSLANPTTFTIDYLYFNGGKVGIGTVTPDEKLTVKGTVHAEEVKVDLSVPGPDYVFEKDYPLPSLEEVKAYIDEHKHLPEVPSAKEMEEEGVQLAAMNMILLKKVEELTLHAIAQEETIKSLRAEHKRRLEALENRVTALSRKMESLIGDKKE